jgi:hypothetical protein
VQYTLEPLKHVAHLNSVSKGAPHFTIANMNWLTMFKEIIAFHSESRTKPLKYTQWAEFRFVRYTWQIATAVNSRDSGS